MIGDHKVGDYTLSYPLIALKNIQTETGDDTIRPSLEKVENGCMITIFLYWFEGLKTHHPEITQQEAGKISSEIGTEKTLNAITTALAAAFPDAMSGGDSGKKTKAS